MPFPGSRRWKLRRPIKASVITGELNFDGVFCLTHADFITEAPDAITLEHADAMQQGGVDLAVSIDEAGTTRLALQVVRCELSATAADSRIELWVRVPAVSDTVDTDVWIWWGDETETLPADDADYGRNDVWNGTTGDGTPIVSWGVWHLDEDPADPAPQYKDSSGNARHVTGESGQVTRNDAFSPGRGANKTGTSLTALQVASVPFAAGTGDFCVIETFAGDSVGYNSTLRTSLTTATSARFELSSATSFAVGVVGTNYATTVASTSDPCFAAFSRDGDAGIAQTNATNANISGLAAVNFDGDSLGFNLDRNDVTTTRVGFACAMTCAPNSYWLRAFYDNILGTSIWDTTYAPAPAEVQATILFDALNAGTEVRVYEEPHPQIWTVDFDAVTPAGLADTYVQFQIQGSSAASDHYIWFDLDEEGTDPEPGGTGHAVAIATGDTDAEMAEAAQAILDAITDLGAAVDGTVVTVTNDRNGELTTPVDGGTDATIVLAQCGGTDTDEIDGIESSTGTSWTAEYGILRPRRAWIVMLSISYENVRYSAILTTSGLVVPAGALQRLDRNYANPT